MLVQRGFGGLRESIALLEHVPIDLVFCQAAGPDTPTQRYPASAPTPGVKSNFGYRPSNPLRREPRPRIDSTVT